MNSLSASERNLNPAPSFPSIVTENLQPIEDCVKHLTSFEASLQVLCRTGLILPNEQRILSTAAQQLQSQCFAAMQIPRSSIEAFKNFLLSRALDRLCSKSKSSATCRQTNSRPTKR